jgi:hypothetical protein
MFLQGSQTFLFLSLEFIGQTSILIIEQLDHLSQFFLSFIEIFQSEYLGFLPIVSIINSKASLGNLSLQSMFLFLSNLVLFTLLL